MMSALRNSIVLLVLAVPLLAGCEEDVVAVLGTDVPYSMWGVLNPLADTQFVRVFLVEGTLNVGEARPLNAQFVSTDRTEGGERVWRDSVIVAERSLVEHIYYAPLRIEYGHTYTLTITGDDGRTSSVEVEVPAQTSLTLGEPDTTGSVLLPITVLNNPPNLIQSEVEFDIGYIVGFSASGCPDYRYIEYAIPYDDRIQPTDGGWRFLINLNEIYGAAQVLVERDNAALPQFGITLNYVQFSTIVANEAWEPPGGTFDPNVLIQPGTMENVENGFGFVGAGYHLSRLWPLSNRVIEQSGFRSDREECP